MEDIGNSWKKEQNIQDVLDTRKEEHDILNNHNDEVRESYTVLMIVSSGQLVVSLMNIIKLYTELLPKFKTSIH